MANVWNAFTTVPGSFSPDTMLLLTDASLIVHDAYSKNWYRLSPNDQGNYQNGTWMGPFPMINTRQFFASGILRDGRMFVIGGEYSDAGNATPLGELFDPRTNTWSAMSKPTSFNWINSDTTGCTLPDGRVLLGAPGSNRTALWDPDSDTWTEAGLAFGASISATKVSNTNEETWNLMPDGSVLTAQVVGAPATERYIPATDRWINSGNTLSTLPLFTLNDPVTSTTVNIREMGPALTLPDGRAFFVGGTGHTALYTPPANPANSGTWAAGPDLPADTSGNNFNNVNGNIQTAIDTPGVLLPNGRILFVGGNTVREVNNGQVQFWSNPCTVFMFDPTANTITQLVPQPPSNAVDAWRARLLLLPTGQVLFTSQQASMSILTVDAALGGPNNAWRPAISNVPSSMVIGHSYVLTGTQFNGLSQACSYGDDAMVATNYPIAQMTNTATNKVVYVRTSAFSSMGIATGATPQTATIQLPADMLPGQYRLVIIANGIASTPSTVQVVKQDCFFIIDRSTYSQGEIQALIHLNGAPAIIETAMYVVVEGFKPGDLGLTTVNLNSPPIRPAIANPATGITITSVGAVIPEDTSLPNSPQRFTFPCRISFQDANVFNFAPTVENLTVSASLTAGGSTVTCNTTIQLIKTPNPYILHGDAAHGYPWYLSTDIRVFQIKAGQTKFAATVGTTSSPRTIATNYIQQVITNLNGSPASAGGLFDALPQDEQAESLALAPTDTGGTPVYNFAVARVRYRDTIPANDVRVFFRLWPAQQTNATYNTSTLYRSATNAGGQKIPLLGVQGSQIMTIPFFATSRVDTASANMNTQTDTPNIHTINADTLGGEVASYFGCWLDINQPNDRVFPVRLIGPNPANLPDGPFTGLGTLLPIQQLVRSEHQCLLAEVSFDPDPIPTNADPSISDKLAQRNLTFVNVPNPGLIDSRRAPQTFEVRPTPFYLPADLSPDELMIEWGNTPVDSLANIYLPEAAADEILTVADALYSTHRLTKVDDFTIQCQTGGVTYLPVLRKLGANFAGLLTIDLPPTVKKGQVYRITVKQITTAVSRYTGRNVFTQQENVRGRAKTTAVAVSTQKGQDLIWRRTLGVFQLTIPVSTKQALLASEERRLSVLRWIEQAIPADDRWYLVFKRYVDQMAKRVGDMGGEPDKVIANPNGNWHKGDSHHPEHPHEPDKGQEKGRGERQRAYSGKIAGLRYDRYGDFSGFLLDTEDGERRFDSREEEMEELVQLAWTERIFCTVYAENHEPHRPLAVVLRGSPEHS